MSGGAAARETAGTSQLRLTLSPRLTPADVETLVRALRKAAGTRLVVLAGSPGVFCDGAALPPASTSSGSFSALLRAVERAPCPVVALVDGTALGGGLGLAAAADLVLATPRASFGLPESLLGMIPAIVLPVLARRVGMPRARLLALGAEPLTAEQARDWGLVDELADDLETTLERRARRLGRMDRRSLAAVKALVARHFAAPAGYEREARARQAKLLRSSGTKTRLERFLAGDAPWAQDDEA